MRLSDPQKKLLFSIRDHSGIFDRHYRVIAGGEVVVGQGSTTLLWALRHDLVKILSDGVFITKKGEEVCRESS